MDDEKKEDDSIYREPPLFFMRCCRKVLFAPSIRFLSDMVILEFTCPYCHHRYILTAEGGLKKALDDCENANNEHKEPSSALND